MISPTILSHVRLIILRCLADVPPAELLRGVVLRTLLGCPEYTANEALLTDMAGDVLGRVPARTEVALAVDALAEVGLVTVRQGAALGVRGAVLTRSGQDVAERRTSVAGVALPATVEQLAVVLADLTVPVPVDDVAAQLDWLAQLGAVAANEHGWSILPAGVDIARGRLVVDGVRRPSSAGAMAAAAARSARSILGS